MANLTLPSKVTKKYSKRYLNYDVFMVILFNPVTVIHTSEFDPDNNILHHSAYSRNFLQSARSRLEAEKIRLCQQMGYVNSEIEKNKFRSQLDNIEKEHPEWLI